ncbi:hypothetical protein EJ07DRAFT_151643 [Lizonia empirigonia]|nr:hypothetical protein EJ07DRAFT_151643 [Lizonia empirigonia]
MDQKAHKYASLPSQQAYRLRARKFLRPLFEIIGRQTVSSQTKAGIDSLSNEIYLEGHRFCLAPPHVHIEASITCPVMPMFNSAIFDRLRAARPQRHMLLIARHKVIGMFQRAPPYRSPHPKLWFHTSASLRTSMTQAANQRSTIVRLSDICVLGVPRQRPAASANIWVQPATRDRRGRDAVV